MRFDFAVPSRARIGGAFALVSLLCGCASGPPPSTTRARAPAEARAPSPDADGPGANPPADLANIADAEPRVEPIRPGGANKPYQALGKSFVPETRDVPFSERGLAPWYGRKFHGRRTASGEVYDMYAMTAAHPTLPIPSYARIRNPANGRDALVRINDRGPFVAGRIVDLSYAAAFKLDLLRGVAPVELERITFEEIRTGAWRGSATSRFAAAPPSTAPVAGVNARGAATAAPVDVPAQDVAFTAAAAEIAARPEAAALPAALPAATTVAANAPVPAPATASAIVANAPSAASAAATAPVAIAAADPRPRLGRAPAEAARGFWVQLAAFRERDGAESFRRRIAADGDASWLEPLIAIFGDAVVYRVQAGPYPNRDDAESAAQRARAALAIVPIVVERR